MGRSEPLAGDGRLATARPPLFAHIISQEVAAYEAALARLEAEGLRPLDERTFQQQLGAAQAEVAGER